MTRAGTSDAHQVWEKQALSRLKLGNGLKFGCAGGALAALKPSHRQKRTGRAQGAEVDYYAKSRVMCIYIAEHPDIIAG